MRVFVGTTCFVLPLSTPVVSWKFQSAFGIDSEEEASRSF